MFKVDVILDYEDETRFTLPNPLILAERDAEIIRMYIVERSAPTPLSSSRSTFGVAWLPDHLFNKPVKSVTFINLYDNSEVFKVSEKEEKKDTNSDHDSEHIEKEEPKEETYNGKYVAKKYVHKMELRKSAPERIQKIAEAINRCDNGYVGEEYDNADIRRLAAIPNITDEEIATGRQLYYNAY